MQRDDLKRKLRKLKKLEYKLRFGHAVNVSPERMPQMLWDYYFDLQDNPIKKARYSMRELMKMDACALKSVIESYLADVYFRAYGISMNAADYDLNAMNELGLPFDADQEIIKKRFRELAKQCHPDAGGDAEQFIKMKERFDALMGK